MKKSILIVFLFSLVTSLFSQETVLKVVTVGDIVRNYRVYLPQAYDGSVDVPIVFNYHGYGSSTFEQEIYADFKPIADTANFLIVFPQGLTQNGNTGFNNFGSLEVLQPELDFFNGMLDELDDDYSVDLSRVYSTGISNGGFMSYDLACYQSEKIAAIASVCGSMMNFHLTNCNPEHPMPIMQLHGTDDVVVLYDGLGDFVYSEPIEDLVDYWIDFNNCDQSPLVTNLPDIDLLDQSTVEHYVYENGTYGVSVEFYKIIGGGHTWPGAFPVPSLGVTNQDFNACKEIWRFFSQYSLDDIVEVDEQLLNTKTEVFPNPTSDFINISYKESCVFTLFNLTGEVLFEKKLVNKREKINLTNLALGVYLYSIRSVENNSNENGKLVINK